MNIEAIVIDNKHQVAIDTYIRKSPDFTYYLRFISYSPFMHVVAVDKVNIGIELSGLNIVGFLGIPKIDVLTTTFNVNRYHYTSLTHYFYSLSGIELMTHLDSMKAAYEKIQQDLNIDLEVYKKWS